MGNNPSRSTTPTTPTSNPQSPQALTASSSSSHGSGSLRRSTSNHSQRSHANPAALSAPLGPFSSQPLQQSSQHLQSQQLGRGGQGPRRRESIQALTVKGSAAPPSANLESAAAHQTSIHAHARSRSQTVAASCTTTTTTAAVAASQLLEKMGNEQSRQKGAPPLRDQHQQRQHQQSPPPRREPRPQSAAFPAPPTPAAPPAPASPAARPATTPPPPPPTSTAAIPVQQQQHQPDPNTIAAVPAATQPVNVPAAPREDQHPGRDEFDSPLDRLVPSDPYFIAPAQFTRPPRLPLPIEEEVHTPGSPIISPEDLAVPLDSIEGDGSLRRPASVLSSTTQDDDELAPEFTEHEGGKPTVPTIIEWEGPGERVYVTGTFAGWNKKFRLHRRGPSKKENVLSAMVNIVPGTHHLKFIVDGEMTTSDKLPTAVDYTNILVNYLEVSLDDVPKPPSAADEVRAPEPAAVPELQVPPGIFPPQVLPPTPELRAVAARSRAEAEKAAAARKKVAPPAEPPKRYHRVIPRYLLDLDAPDESPRMGRAAAATSNLPTPPTLPMFLSKSILNGTMPMKDDSSVLILPNHTVLNHLATSSIKDNILATSATTRYKQKFLTTIMYKPKDEHGHRD